MTSSKLKMEFYSRIKTISVKAYNIQNRVKIVTKTEHLGKLSQRKKIEIDLKVLWSTFDKVIIQYFALQDYILEKNAIIELEMYELEDIPKQLNPLYRIIKTVTLSLYASLAHCERLVISD